MKKAMIIGSVAVFVFLLFMGCNEWQPRPVFYKNIEQAELQLPNSCDGSQNDVCATFSCLTPNCWCKDSPETVLVKGTNTKKIENNIQARKIVEDYLLKTNIEGFIITSSVQLNNIFYNVFVEDELGDELVYTVAIDGAIIETVCGV